MTFGQTLAKIRRSKGKSQRAIAKIIGMEFSYFSRLENDRFPSKPTRNTVEKIANALECNEEERLELLGSAGRIDESIEQAAKLTNESPDMRTLFRIAPKLSPERLRALVKKAEKELANQT